MSWTNINKANKPRGRYDIIYDGDVIVDARIYFGKFCHNKKRGILLSEIIDYPDGVGYIRWMQESSNFEEDIMEACNAIIGNELECDRIPWYEFGNKDEIPF
jgi:hypothetical protein